jgi:hypothetical protein
MYAMAIPATLPQVRGQHRNRALAAARQARAVELATRGLTYQQIADELGYSNRGTVYRLVHSALTRDLQEDVESHRRLERDRLDALQVPLWDRAMAGDTTAAHQVIQIIRARCRLLGLDLRVKPFGAPAQSPRTVVLTSEEREALGLDQRDGPPHSGC